MYSLFFLVTVASMLLYTKLYLANPSERYILSYFFVTVLGFYTHFYYVFVFGVQVLYAIYRRVWQRIEWKALVAFSCFLAFFLVPFARDAMSVGSGVGLNIPWGFTASIFWQEMFTYLSDGMFGAIIGVPIFIYGLVHTFRGKSKDVAVLTGLWVFAPLCLLFAITALIRPMTHNRYVIFILPAYLMMLAYGLIQLCEKIGRRRSMFGAFFLATMIFGTFAAMTIVTFPLQRREDWRAVTQYLNAHVAEDDYILTYPPGCDKCLDYYEIQHNYYHVGTYNETVEWALERNCTVWLVYYGWGVQKAMFEGLLFPVGFEVALGCYQISIYKR